MLTDAINFIGATGREEERKIKLKREFDARDGSNKKNRLEETIGRLDIHLLLLCEELSGERASKL